MSRQRLSWDKEAAAATDPSTMNQDRTNPPAEKYRTGDPEAWGEGVDKSRPWESEKRTETGHPAPAREAVKAARKLEDKAIKCITIAQRMLPGASDDVIEEQATDLMYLPETSVLSTLQRQASLAETLTASDDADANEKAVEAKKEEAEAKKEEAEEPVVEEKDEKEEKAVEAKKEEAEEPVVEEEEEKAVEAKKAPVVEEEEKEECAVEASDDLLDKIFASQEIVPEKVGAKKLSGIVKKASGSDPLDSLWDAPPDVSKVFGR